MERQHVNEEIILDLEGVSLPAFLNLPEEAKGLVVFVHGSGSSRHSPRNQFVADYLQKEGMGTLLIDLLTKEEGRKDEITRELRFDIPFLAKRVEAVTDWVASDKSLSHLSLGYFGASTGAAAALIASVVRQTLVKAIVSRGGRPDLAAPILSEVRAPTLLIVGGNDFGVIELNQKAYDLLPCEKQFSIIEGATHLFEEPGSMERVVRLTAAWFAKYL